MTLLRFQTQIFHVMVAKDNYNAIRKKEEKKRNIHFLFLSRFAKKSSVLFSSLKVVLNRFHVHLTKRCTPLLTWILIHLMLPNWTELMADCTDEKSPFPCLSTVMVFQIGNLSAEMDEFAMNNRMKKKKMKMKESNFMFS